MQEFASSHQREVGDGGIPLFIRILRSEDSADDEITEAVLKILLDIVSDSDEAVGNAHGRAQGGPTPGERNAGLLLADPRNVELFLDLLRCTHDGRMTCSMLCVWHVFSRACAHPRCDVRGTFSIQSFPV